MPQVFFAKIGQTVALGELAKGASQVVWLMLPAGVCCCPTVCQRFAFPAKPGSIGISGGTTELSSPKRVLLPHK